MRVLHLILKKRWFDLIASGIKKEEYREAKPFWDIRLKGKNFDVIHFRNGYAKDAPTMVVEFLGLGKGLGRREWGGGADPVYVISLGDIISINHPDPAVEQ